MRVGPVGASPEEPAKGSWQQLRRAAAEGVRAAAAWLERHPVAAWTAAIALALAIAVRGVPEWPQPHWGGQFGGRRGHAGDALGIQAVCALGDRGQLLSWFTGPSIDERTYRPFCNLLYWAEFQLWGTWDVYYSWLSVALHLANAVLLLALAAELARLEGRRGLGARLLIGLAAALMFAGPGFVDPQVLRWMLGYWPSQGDSAALACGLLGLLLFTRYLGRPSAGLLAGSIGALTAAALFKEIAYTALLAALALSVRRGGRVAACSLGLATAVVLTCRFLALRGHAYYEANYSLAMWLRLVLGPGGIHWAPLDAWNMYAGGATLCALAVLRHRGMRASVALAASAAVALVATQVTTGTFMLLAIADHFALLLRSCISILVAFLVLREALRRRVVAILLGAWLLACYAVSPYRLALGWYQYWPSALRALLLAAVLPEVAAAAAWLFGMRSPSSRQATQSVLAERPLPAPPRGRHDRWPGLALAAAALAGAGLLGSWVAAASRRPHVLCSAASAESGRGGPLPVEVCQPVGGEIAGPALLLLPGDLPLRAGWTTHRLAAGLARLGYVTVAPTAPRLAAGALAIEESQQLLRWTRAHAGEYSVDPDAVGIVGWGSGGGIAFLLGTRELMQKPPDAPAGVAGRTPCVVEFCGDLDANGLPEAAAREPGPPADASPWIRMPSTTSPEFGGGGFLLVYGHGDPRHVSYVRAGAALGALGARVELFEADEDGQFPLERDYWKRSLDHAIEFLFRALPPPHTS
jgi:acetyl esterase/lipase